MIDELLREARPDTTPPQAVVVLRARRSLLRKATAGRRRRILVRTAVGITAAAAVLAVLGIAQSPEHGASPAAAAILDRSASTIESTSPVDGYVYRRMILTSQGYTPTPRVDDGVETWIPVDRNRPVIQRTTDKNGEVTFAEVDQDQTEAAAMYRDKPHGSTAVLGSLRDYSRQVSGGDSDREVWGAAFSLLADPQTPDDLRAEVLRALAGLEGVRVSDRNVQMAGKSGVAIRYPGRYEPEMVFDPTDGTFLGLRGFPEKDKTWTGPDEPMWTITFETKHVDTAPSVPR